MPTPTATPALLDDAQLVSFSPTGPITQNNPILTIHAEFFNDGASTWNFPNYALKCVQYCGNSWNSAYTSLGPTAPGQSATFSGSEAITSLTSYSVNTIIWQLWSPGSGFFGQQMTITVIHHGWYLDFQEASPSCMGDGSQWLTQGSGGTITCGASDLDMAQGGSGGIGLELQATPASYDPGNYGSTVHIHFTSTSSGAFAGVIVTEPTATAKFRMVVMVSPAGYVCEQSNTAYCFPASNTQAIPASSDYDISVTVANNGTTVSQVYSPGGYSEGGISAGGLTGLIEVSAAGDTDTAYFSNYKLYQWK